MRVYFDTIQGRNENMSDWRKGERRDESMRLSREKETDRQRKHRSNYEESYLRIEKLRASLPRL